MNKFIQFLALAALALVLSGASVVVERIGPETAPYGNLCGAAANDPCLQPVLKGGFPVAFLFDQPGVSVERQLSFEDVFHEGAIAINTACYLLGVGLIAFVFGKRSKNVRSERN